MTREEIVSQARVGGYATVRLEIASIQPGDLYILRLIGRYVDNGDFGVWVTDDDVISIEPPSFTIEQQLANALAEIAELEKGINNTRADLMYQNKELKAEIERLKAINAGIMAEKSIFPAPSTGVKIPWYGGECPVPPQTKVKVYLGGGTKGRDIAGNYGWEHGNSDGDIIAYEVLT